MSARVEERPDATQAQLNDHAPRQMSAGENAALTVKVLLGGAVVGGLIWLADHFVN